MFRRLALTTVFALIVGCAERHTRTTRITEPDYDRGDRVTTVSHETDDGRVVERERTSETRREPADMPRGGAPNSHSGMTSSGMTSERGAERTESTRTYRDRDN